VEEGLKLPAALRLQERVQLVDHDEGELAEQRLDPRAVDDEEGFERLGGDDEDPARLLQHPALAGCRHVAVPAVDRNLQFGAEQLQALELIVDQGLERADVERLHTAARMIHERREDGKERGLGLAGGGGGGEDHVAVPVQYGGDGVLLDVAQLRPALLPEPALDLRVQAVKRRRGG
jgi:hypothetical protein